MHRNHEITSPPASGGQPLTGSLHGIENYAPHNSILLTPDPPFKRHPVTQAIIDGICVVFGFLFLCSVAASLPLAVVILVMAGD